MKIQILDKPKLLLDRINEVFKTEEEALNFFLKNTKTIAICKLCKKHFLIKEIKKRKYCCSLCYSYFQNTHTFFNNSKMKFRRNLALFYFLYLLSIYYDKNFQKKFTNIRASKHVVYSEVSRFIRHTKKRFSTIKLTHFHQYNNLFTKLGELLRNY